jgi:hypothetical protein
VTTMPASRGYLFSSSLPKVSLCVSSSTGDTSMRFAVSSMNFTTWAGVHGPRDGKSGKAVWGWERHGGVDARVPKRCGDYSMSAGEVMLTTWCAGGSTTAVLR